MTFSKIIMNFPLTPLTGNNIWSQFPKKKFVLKEFWVPKYFFPKKILGEKKFSLKKYLV